MKKKKPLNGEYRGKLLHRISQALNTLFDKNNTPHLIDSIIYLIDKKIKEEKFNEVEKILKGLSFLKNVVIFPNKETGINLLKNAISKVSNGIVPTPNRGFRIYSVSEKLLGAFHKHNIELEQQTGEAFLKKSIKTILKNIDHGCKNEECIVWLMDLYSTYNIHLDKNVGREILLEIIKKSIENISIVETVFQRGGGSAPITDLHIKNVLEFIDGFSKHGIFLTPEQNKLIIKNAFNNIIKWPKNHNTRDKEKHIISLLKIIPDLIENFFETNNEFKNNNDSFSPQEIREIFFETIAICEKLNFLKVPSILFKFSNLEPFLGENNFLSEEQKQKMLKSSIDIAIKKNNYYNIICILNGFLKSGIVLNKECNNTYKAYENCLKEAIKSMASRGEFDENLIKPFIEKDIVNKNECKYIYFNRTEYQNILEETILKIVDRVSNKDKSTSKEDLRKIIKIIEFFSKYSILLDGNDKILNNIIVLTVNKGLLKASYSILKYFQGTGIVMSKDYDNSLKSAIKQSCSLESYEIANNFIDYIFQNNIPINNILDLCDGVNIGKNDSAYLSSTNGNFGKFNDAMLPLSDNIWNYLQYLRNVKMLDTNNRDISHKEAISELNNWLNLLNDKQKEIVKRVVDDIKFFDSDEKKHIAIIVHAINSDYLAWQNDYLDPTERKVNFMQSLESSAPKIAHIGDKRTCDAGVYHRMYEQLALMLKGEHSEISSALFDIQNPFFMKNEDILMDHNIFFTDNDELLMEQNKKFVRGADLLYKIRESLITTQAFAASKWDNSSIKLNMISAARNIGEDSSNLTLKERFNNLEKEVKKLLNVNVILDYKIKFFLVLLKIDIKNRYCSSIEKYKNNQITQICDKVIQEKMYDKKKFIKSLEEISNECVKIGVEGIDKNIIDMLVTDVENKIENLLKQKKNEESMVDEIQSSKNYNNGDENNSNDGKEKVKLKRKHKERDLAIENSFNEDNNGSALEQINKKNKI